VRTGDFEKCKQLLEDIYSRPLPAPGETITIPVISALRSDPTADNDKANSESKEWLFTRPKVAYPLPLFSLSLVFLLP